MKSNFHLLYCSSAESMCGLCGITTKMHRSAPTFLSVPARCTENAQRSAMFLFYYCLKYQPHIPLEKLNEYRNVKYYLSISQCSLHLLFLFHCITFLLFLQFHSFHVTHKAENGQVSKAENILYSSKKTRDLIMT